MVLLVWSSTPLGPTRSLLVPFSGGILLCIWMRVSFWFWQFLKTCIPCTHSRHRTHHGPCPVYARTACFAKWYKSCFHFLESWHWVYLCDLVKKFKYLCIEGSLYSFDFPSLVPTLDANVDVGDQQSNDGDDDYLYSSLLHDVKIPPILFPPLPRTPILSTYVFLF